MDQTTVELNPVRLYTRRGGDAPPVAVLHGGLGAPPVGGPEDVADLEALRDHWGLEQVTLLGYSWGGLLAVLYALEHPARIDRLVLLSSAPLTPGSRRERHPPPAPP